MKIRSEQWGNDLALRIPEEITAMSGLALNSEVELIVQDGFLILKPVPSQRNDLATLLQGITAENQQEEWDMGSAVGDEVG